MSGATKPRPVHVSDFAREREERIARRAGPAPAAPPPPIDLSLPWDEEGLRGLAADLDAERAIEREDHIATHARLVAAEERIDRLHDVIARITAGVGHTAVSRALGGAAAFDTRSGGTRAVRDVERVARVAFARIRPAALAEEVVEALGARRGVPGAILRHVIDEAVNEQARREGFLPDVAAPARSSA
jgi:hypothetical protein